MWFRKINFWHLNALIWEITNGVFLVAMLISSLNDKLYLCGTIGGITTSFISRNSVISSVLSIDIDVYNKEQVTWEHCCDTVIAHHNAGTTSVSSLIYRYIIGGTTTQTVNRIFRSVDFFLHWYRRVSGVKDLPYPCKWIQYRSLNWFLFWNWSLETFVYIRILTENENKITNMEINKIEFAIKYQ